MTRLKEIEERLGKATKGPWEITCFDNDAFMNTGAITSDERIIVFTEGETIWFDVKKKTPKRFDPKDDDIELITNAPSDIEYLIGEVKRLERKREAIKNKIQTQIDLSEALWENETEKDDLIYDEGMLYGLNLALKYLEDK